MNGDEVSIRISDLRSSKNLTQRDLSDSIGVTENTIANWEKGRSIKSWLVRIKKLCDVLDCSFEELIEEDNSSEEKSKQ